MPKKKGEKCDMHEGSCNKCGGAMMLLLGILVLLNANYSLVSWAVFIGIILLIKGLKYIVMPCCPHCK